VPELIDMFDRGISQGETPRLWIDAVAHVMMGRDKRIYRFVQDTRFGRTVARRVRTKVSAIVEAVTSYVARRMVERETRAGRNGLACAREGRDAATQRFWRSRLASCSVAAALFRLGEPCSRQHHAAAEEHEATRRPSTRHSSTGRDVGRTVIVSSIRNRERITLIAPEVVGHTPLLDSITYLILDDAARVPALQNNAIDATAIASLDELTIARARRESRSGALPH